MDSKALAAATLLLATLGAGCTGSIDRSGGEKSPTTLVLASSKSVTGLRYSACCNLLMDELARQ